MASRLGGRTGATSLSWRTAAILGVILLAFGLRLLRLDHQSLWVDEATSAYLTSLSPAQIVLNRANGFHPPTYFLALAGWTSLAGRSEFSLRFVSAALGLLLVPLLYRVARRLFGDARTGLLAALLGGLSPAHVVYSQEARTYAVLPVAYLLVVACGLSPGGLRSRRDWLCFALSEVLCLYLHPFSGFVLLAINLLLLATRLWHASRQTWMRWGVSQVLVGLSYVPWLLAMWSWGRDVPAKLSRGDWRAAGMSLNDFLRLVWRFLNSGQVGLSEADAMVDWIGVLALVVPLSLLLVCYLDLRRRELLVTVGAFLLPLAGAYPVWFMRPLAHPRYLLFLLAPLSIVSARVLAVLALRRVTWVVGVILAGAILAADVAGLRLVFFDPRFFRFDMRALAAAVAERAIPGEAVLMPPADYSLWYYDPMPAESVNLPGRAGAEGGQLRLEELGPLLAGRPGAFLVTYRDLRGIDPRDQIPYLLETNGRLTERFSVDRMEVAHYHLEDWTDAELVPAAARCGPLMLTGVYSQAAATADNAVTVALGWQLAEPTERDHKAAVRLWDGAQSLTGADVPLLNDLGRPTHRWGVGEETVNTYVLPLPLGTMPLTYTLSAAVYDGWSGKHLPWKGGGEWLALGPVQILRAVNQTSDPYGSWSGAEWVLPAVSEVAPGLLLEGYAVRPAALTPADAAYVSLRWRATRGDLARYAPLLVLAQGGAVLAKDPGSLFERYATDRWAVGELLIETRRLLIPPTLDPLKLALEVGERWVPLGEVAVARDALQWEVPASAEPICARVGDVAELVGYDWEPASQGPGGGVLKLYWRASVGSPVAESHTVFTHMMSPDGVLLAQHDGLPDRGRRATNTWLPNEVITDRHELSLGELYAGPVRLVVGMYDLETKVRLPAYDCAGHRLPDDAIPVAETP